MKKIIIILLCVVMCTMLSGCTLRDVYKPESDYSTTYAMVIMPDGSIVKGKCNAFTRISSEYAMVKINGVKFYTNEWRIVIWEDDI